MKKEEFLKVLEKILNLDKQHLSGDERLDEINWDSLSVVRFLAMCDDELGVQLRAREVSLCKSVSDLMELLSVSE
ncbi:acyl carrier protein [Pajaroellobacter abortibovis]|uniref:Carrier domain-containing protein n=1 Tax=Pajaroellobacter abortibovis TaxID=1882918 RepID=A0A1L6MYM7_9BACT|nr:acyl carrier protein [Pajaroellobacter abortibovis]APS00606.1 hypothetical protein BCY86_07920 [Pajaroellobacter abortibovis]